METGNESFGEHVTLGSYTETESVYPCVRSNANSLVLIL